MIIFLGIVIGVIFAGVGLVSVAMHNLPAEKGSFAILYGFTTVLVAYLIFAASVIG